MTTIANVTLPAEVIPVGRVLGEFLEVEAELERIVPIRESRSSVFRTRGGDPKAIAATLRDHPEVEELIDAVISESEASFDVRWHDDHESFATALADARARVLSGTWTGEAWDLRIRFPSHQDLSAFNKALTDSGTSVTLNRLIDPKLKWGGSRTSPPTGSSDASRSINPATSRSRGS